MKTFTMEKTIPLSLTLMETLPSKKIVSGRYDLSFTMITEAESTNADTLLNAQYDQNVSFSKVFLFIEQFVNHSVIFESDVLTPKAKPKDVAAASPNIIPISSMKVPTSAKSAPG